MKGNHFSRSSSVSILPSNHKFSIHESCNGLLEYLSSVERCSLFQSPGLKRSQLTNAYSTTSEISEKDNTNEPQELATSAPTVIDSEWAVVSRDELLSDGEPTLAQRSDSTSTICFFDDTKDHHSSMRRKLQGILKDPTSAANKLRPKKKVTFDSACMLASRILKIMPTEFELDHEDRSPLGQDLDYKPDTDEDNDEYEDEMDDLESDDKEVSSPLLALHLSDQEESEDIDNISYINSIRNQRILLSDNDMSSSPLSSIDHNDYKKSAPQLQKYTPKLSDIAFPPIHGACLYSINTKYNDDSFNSKSQNETRHFQIGQKKGYIKSLFEDPDQRPALKKRRCLGVGKHRQLTPSLPSKKQFQTL